MYVPMDFTHLTTLQWILAGCAALSVGISKAGFNGMGMITVILMASVIPPRESTGVVLPMLIAADVFAVAAFHRHARGAHLLALLPPAVAGIVAGWLLMPHISPEKFGPVIGGIVLGLVALHYARRTFPAFLQHLPASRSFAWGMGSLAGLVTMLANAAGPVMNLYLLAKHLSKMDFVGTSAVFFFAVNLIKVPFSVSLGLIHPGSLLFNALLLPAVFAGLFFGKWLLHRIPQRIFEELLLIFSLLGAIRLLF